MIKKIIVIMILLVLLLLTFSGCKKKESGPKNTLNYNIQSEPGSMDPEITTDSAAFTVLSMAMEGLVVKGSQGTIEPGVAEKWSSSKNGKKWTFYLRDDAKWSNGAPVTANDFVTGWQRALDPQTAAAYAYILYPIKNAEKYNAGEIKNFNLVGVKAVSSNKLEVTLESPTPYFLELLTFMTYLPLNGEYYKKVGKEYAMESDKMLYNGPFIISEWKHGGKMVLKKNNEYWNASKTKLEQINFLMIDDGATVNKMFIAKQLDMIGSSTKPKDDSNSKQFEQIKKISNKILVPSGVVSYIQLNTAVPALKNKKIRQAISYAIDRKRLNEITTNGDNTPAYSFIPKGITIGNLGEYYKLSQEKYFEDNQVKQAQELLAEGKKESNINGEITLTLLIDTGEGVRREAEFIQEELKSKLGINVKIEANTYQIRLQKTHSKNYEMVLAGWAPDYNDPMTYLDMFMTNNGNNETNWGSAKYDQLIQNAQMSSDEKQRLKDFQQAEAILMDEFPIIPTDFDTTILALNKQLTNVYYIFGTPCFNEASFETQKVEK